MRSRTALCYTLTNTSPRVYSLDFHSVNHEAGSDNEAIKQPLPEPWPLSRPGKMVYPGSSGSC